MLHVGISGDQCRLVFRLSRRLPARRQKLGRLLRGLQGFVIKLELQ